MVKEYKLVDLTHGLHPEIPSWGGGCGFHADIKLDYEKGGFRVQQIKMHAGISTHMDAPSHCIPGAVSIADLDINNFLAPARIIDTSLKRTPDYTVSLEDILAHEKQYGSIAENSLVFFYTGWDDFWNNPSAYRNNYVFPKVGKDACSYLLQKNIVGIGIDTLSPDRPADGFDVHQMLLGSGKYILENVANLGNLPPAGAFSMALPIKFIDGTEAPTRVVAFIK